jgi:hypothetical protein
MISPIMRSFYAHYTKNVWKRVISHVTLVVLVYDIVLTVVWIWQSSCE